MRGQRATIGRVKKFKNQSEQEEVIAETASKLADKTRELNAKGSKDLTDATRCSKRSELSEARRAQELA